jgi:hypothetical protein
MPVVEVVEPMVDLQERRQELEVLVGAEMVQTPTILERLLVTDHQEQ